MSRDTGARRLDHRGVLLHNPIPFEHHDRDLDDLIAQIGSGPVASTSTATKRSRAPGVTSDRWLRIGSEDLF